MFLIKSEEKHALCPKCGEQLEYHSTIKRNLKEITGEKNTYGIRVLKCVNEACPTTYHRELPDIMIAYKRYDAASIEETLTNSHYEITVGADESTIWRWRKWFTMNAVQIIMALISVLITIDDKAETASLEIKNQKTNNSIERIKKILKRSTKWLSETTRILVNSSKWIFNRSAYLVSRV